MTECHGFDSEACRDATRDTAPRARPRSSRCDRDVDL